MTLHVAEIHRNSFMFFDTCLCAFSLITNTTACFQKHDVAFPKSALVCPTSENNLRTSSNANVGFPKHVVFRSIKARRFTEPPSACYHDHWANMASLRRNLGIQPTVITSRQVASEKQERRQVRKLRQVASGETRRKTSLKIILRSGEVTKGLRGRRRTWCSARGHMYALASRGLRGFCVAGAGLGAWALPS